VCTSKPTLGNSMTMATEYPGHVVGSYLCTCEGTRWAWYTLVQNHKQFILDQ
jgi:hypothetical protein